MTQRVPDPRRKPRRVSPRAGAFRVRDGRGLFAAAAVFLAWCAGNAPAQLSPRLAAAIGPFPIETSRGVVEARLSRCDSNTLWIVREGASGAYEAGLPLSEVKRVAVPTPRIFTAAEQASTADMIKAAHEAMDRLIAMLRPFRNVPGIPYYEALLRKAQLYDRQGLWRDSIRLYEDLLKPPTDAPWKQMARWRAGVAYELGGEHQRAVELLDGVPLPEDEILLSSVLFSRGMARAALNRHRDALTDFLYLVVFHPFVQDNERRGLDAAMNCYAEIKDWESLLKTAQWMQKEYPGTAEARHAAELLSEYRAQLEQVAPFVGVEMPAKASAAPAAEQPACPPANAATIEDIEVN
jgi:tetratricopeptide (TPR) repeat protein